jgi:hypothetical protein
MQEAEYQEQASQATQGAVTEDAADGGACVPNPSRYEDRGGGAGP